MSGCHPTNTCLCYCHTTGIKSTNAIHPGMPCCYCPPIKLAKEEPQLNEHDTLFTAYNMHQLRERIYELEQWTRKDETLIKNKIEELDFDVKKQTQRIDCMYDGVKGIDYLNQQLEELRGQVKDLEESYQGQFHEISHLEDEVKDLHKKDVDIFEQEEVMNKRLDRLDGIIIDTLVGFEKRIHKLEKSDHPSITETCHDVEMGLLQARVNVLKEHYADMDDEIAALQAHADKVDVCFGKVLESGREFFIGKAMPTLGEKKPHKCPVCSGSGAMQLESLQEEQMYKKELMRTSDGKPFIWCRACKGTGIVWG